MRNSRNHHLLDPNTSDFAVKRALIGLGTVISVSLAFVLVLQMQGGLSDDAFIIGIGTIPVLFATYLAYREYIESAGIIMAGSLTIIVTVIATNGEGVYDVGVMAFPSILIIASLVLRRNSVIYLTGLIILCNAWLVFGDILGLYQPIFPQQSFARNFFVAAIILVVTMVAVHVLSNTVRRSLIIAETELVERQKVEQALRETEAMYRALVEQTSVVTYRDLPDIQATALYISPQIKDLIGYSQAEWTDSPDFWKSLVHPEDLGRVLNEVERYVSTGKNITSEYRMRTKDNRWIWVRDEAVVIKDSNGSPQFVHGVYIDITEQKTAEQALKKREAILGAVAETAQLLLKSMDWREEIKGILKMLGEATGASHVYVFENHPGVDDVTLSSQRYEWVEPGLMPELDNPVYQNTRLIPIPGIEDWYLNLSTGKPFYGSNRQYPRYWNRVFEERGLKTLLDVPILVNGNWWGIIGFDDYKNEMPWSQAEIDALVAAAGNLGTAIERQQADEALRFSERKFQLAFHHTYVAMAINRKKDHILLDVNDAFCKVTGYPREEAIGKRAGRDLNIWERQEDRDTILNTLEQQGFIDEYRAAFRKKNGEVGIGLLSAVNVTIAGEECHLFSFYDISRIDQLVNELKAKNEELQNFTYTVSHDLKAPLVTISGFMGYLEQDAKKGDVERVSKDALRINEAVTKMQRLLNELLELSRIGRLMNTPEEMPFGEIVEEALKLVEGRLSANRVQVRVEAGLPSVFGDRVRLVEVIQNLVDNSAKFMGEQPDPLIEIGVKPDESSRVFYIRDNGIGIEADQHDRIFGLFNKLDANTEGTGIGLALVKRIVDVHGGRIWIESEGKGHGATFYFTLANHQKAGN